MKKLIGQFLLGAVALGVGFVGASQGQAAGLGGSWYSGSTTISVSEKDGFIDVMGKDGSTIFTCSGIIDKTADGTFVDCYGGGVNHNSENRFAYKSRFKLIEKGAAIDEVWEVRFAAGATRKYNGDATYRRKKPETK